MDLIFGPKEGTIEGKVDFEAALNAGAQFRTGENAFSFNCLQKQVGLFNKAATAFEDILWELMGDNDNERK